MEPGLQAAQLCPAPFPSDWTDVPDRPVQPLGSALQDPPMGSHLYPCALCQQLI